MPYTLNTLTPQQIRKWKHTFTTTQNKVCPCIFRNMVIRRSYSFVCFISTSQFMHPNALHNARPSWGIGGRRYSSNNCGSSLCNKREHREIKICWKWKDNSYAIFLFSKRLLLRLCTLTDIPKLRMLLEKWNTNVPLPPSALLQLKVSNTKKQFCGWGHYKALA